MNYTAGKHYVRRNGNDVFEYVKKHYSYYGENVIVQDEFKHINIGELFYPPETEKMRLVNVKHLIGEQIPVVVKITSVFLQWAWSNLLRSKSTAPLQKQWDLPMTPNNKYITEALFYDDAEKTAFIIDSEYEGVQDCAALSVKLAERQALLQEITGSNNPVDTFVILVGRHRHKRVYLIKLDSKPEEVFTIPKDAGLYGWLNMSHDEVRIITNNSQQR